MSEGWGEPAESAGEEREENKGAWDGEKNVEEGGKTGEGWEENENEEKGSGVGGHEEGDEEVVPAADREGEEGTGHGEGEHENREGRGAERLKGLDEDPGRTESDKNGGGEGEEGGDENVKGGAPPEVNQMHTLKVDNLPYRVEANELREEFQRLVRDSVGGGVWGEDGTGKARRWWWCGVCVVGEEREKENCVRSLRKRSRVRVQRCPNQNPYVSFDPVMMMMRVY